MKKIIFLIYIIITAITLSSCNKVDINQTTIVTAIGIDKTETGFKLSIQILNPYVLGKFPKDSAPVVVVSSEGETVFEAVRKLAGSLQNKLFLSHFQDLILEEEIAKEGIEKYINFFFTDHESQHSFNVIIVKEKKAEEILKVQTFLSLIPALPIKFKIESAQKNYGTTKILTISEIINNMNTEGVGLALPGIELVGDSEKGSENDNLKSTQPKGFFIASTIAVFKENKFIGWLNEKESLGYNYIMGNIESSVVPVILKNNDKVSAEVNKIKSKIIYNYKNGTLSFNINIKVFITVGEDSSGKVKHTKEYMEEIETEVSKEVTKLANECIDKVQKSYKSDVFKIASIIHKKNPKLWNSIKDKYDQFFENLDINVNVKTSTYNIRY